MSILNKLLSSYGDDIARAAGNKIDDVARIAANKVDNSPSILNSLLDGGDDVAMFSKQSPISNAQMSLLDYKPEVAAVKSVASSNPYAPVNGKFTKAMQDRAAELVEASGGFNDVANNELYNMIRPETLPKGYGKLRNLLDERTNGNDAISKLLKDRLGTSAAVDADVDSLLDFVWGGDNLEKRVFKKSVEDKTKKYISDAKALGLTADNAAEEVLRSEKWKLGGRAYDKAKQEVFSDIMQESDTDDIMSALADMEHRGVRSGYPGALDTILSERLDIAPGNTVKVVSDNYSKYGNKGSAGRYTRNAKDIAINRSGLSTPEGKVSTMAHERLHSFQNEARPENLGRYDKQVTDAYKELSQSLEPFRKDRKEIIKRYGRSNPEYWEDYGEQESRMFQQYLENKGYTNDYARKLMGRDGEWGDEINPAFDKFIDKLRELSSRGIALPAAAGLLGGGSILGALLGGNGDERRA